MTSQSTGSQAHLTEPSLLILLTPVNDHQNLDQSARHQEHQIRGRSTEMVNKEQEFLLLPSTRANQKDVCK